MKKKLRIIQKWMSAPLELWLIPDREKGEEVLPWMLILGAWLFLGMVGFLSCLVV